MLIRDFDLTSLSDRLSRKALLARRPLSCHFELTYHCSFKCPMCYIRMTDEQAAPYGRLRTVDEWLDMAKQAYEAGVLYLTLTGGECTTYPGFNTLYPALCEMGFRVSLMSNAGYFSPELKRILQDYPPYGVSVTLYGGSNETYEAVTGMKNGLDRVLENIRFLQSIQIPVSLNFTMIRQNVRDYPLVGAICKSLGIPYTLITDITPHGRNAAYSDAFNCRLSPAQRACVACHGPDEVELALQNAEVLEQTLADYRPPAAEDPTPRELSACVGSYNSACIYWNGEMGTCPSLAGSKCYSPFEVGFETAWQQMMTDHSQRFRKPAVCAGCEMQEDCIHSCPGRNFEGTGDSLTPDPYTCQYVWLLRKYKQSHGAEAVVSSPRCS